MADEKTPEEQVDEVETTDVEQSTPEAVEAKAAEAPAADDAAAEKKPRRRTRRKDAEGADEPAAKPARRTWEPGERPVVSAHAKYVRSSARKARLVCDHIRRSPTRNRSHIQSRSSQHLIPRQFQLANFRKRIQ